MELCKGRVVALIAFVVGLLGVTVANAHSAYRFSGFDDLTCAGQSGIGANDVAVLERAGAVAYIDDRDPAGECVAVANVPSGSHYSGFADAICSAKSFVGENDIRALKDAGAVAYINNRDPGAGCVPVPVSSPPG